MDDVIPLGCLFMDWQSNEKMFFLKRAQALITLESNKGGLIKHSEGRKTAPASDLNLRADNTVWCVGFSVCVNACVGS